ncbi:MAG: DUF1289 domain-containing protein [Aeromonadaceae bacterium]
MSRGLPSRSSEQLELFELASPCISVCQSDERGYCLGCHRSRAERFAWQKMTRTERQEVLRLCRDRARRKRRAAAESSALPPTQLTLDGLDEP